MTNLLGLLIKLQDTDSRILEKRIFIDNAPNRFSEVDEPLKIAKSELEKIKQKNDLLAKKRREKEAILEEINEKINKMRSRVSEIKTNKEYQAHLKEIDTLGKEISNIEEEILLSMEDFDNSLKEHNDKEKEVQIEVEKINAFKKELDKEVDRYKEELNLLKNERAKVVEIIDPDIYQIYMTLLDSGNGVAVTRAKNEICNGCNMNVPPQLFVEIKKNEEIIHCPQCRRILYYLEEL